MQKKFKANVKFELQKKSREKFKYLYDSCVENKFFEKSLTIKQKREKKHKMNKLFEKIENFFALKIF